MKRTLIEQPSMIEQFLELVKNKQPLRFLEGFTDLLEAYRVGNNVYIFYRFDGHKEELPYLVEKISEENQFA